MHRHQRGGAGGVDADRRAFEAEGVGDAAGDDARSQAGREISLARGGGGDPVLVRHHTGEDAGRAALQRERVDAAVLQRLPGGFQQEPLLGVHRQRLAGTDPEELRIELTGVEEEASLARIAGAGGVGIGVVEALEVPASVAGKRRDRVAPLLQEPPELPGRGDAAGEAAGHPYDRDGLASVLFEVRQAPLRRAQFTRHLSQVFAEYFPVSQLVVMVPVITRVKK